jgi:hypothetical protein
MTLEGPSLPPSLTFTEERSRSSPSVPILTLDDSHISTNPPNVSKYKIHRSAASTMNHEHHNINDIMVEENHNALNHPEASFIRTSADKPNGAASKIPLNYPAPQQLENIPLPSLPSSHPPHINIHSSQQISSNKSSQYHQPLNFPETIPPTTTTPTTTTNGHHSFSTELDSAEGTPPPSSSLFPPHARSKSGLDATPNGFDSDSNNPNAVAAALIRTITNPMEPQQGALLQASQVHEPHSNSSSGRSSYREKRTTSKKKISKKSGEISSNVIYVNKHQSPSNPVGNKIKNEKN